MDDTCPMQASCNILKGMIKSRERFRAQLAEKDKEIEDKIHLLDLRGSQLVEKDKELKASQDRVEELTDAVTGSHARGFRDGVMAEKKRIRGE